MGQPGNIWVTRRADYYYYITKACPPPQPPNPTGDHPRHHRSDDAQTEQKQEEENIIPLSWFHHNEGDENTNGYRSSLGGKGRKHTLHGHKNTDKQTGLWQKVKWLLGRVGSGGTANRPCHSRLLCFTVMDFFPKDTDADKKVTETAREDDGIRKETDTWGQSEKGGDQV